MDIDARQALIEVRRGIIEISIILGTEVHFLLLYQKIND